MCKFVLTYAYCDWDVNGAIGVYDDPNEVMGEIIGRALDIWDSRKTDGDTDPEFQFKFVHDSANDNFYDVEISYPWDSDNHDTYRVYYLREEDKDV